jgi:hypothetical protein
VRFPAHFPLRPIGPSDLRRGLLRTMNSRLALVSRGLFRRQASVRQRAVLCRRSVKAAATRAWALQAWSSHTWGRLADADLPSLSYRHLVVDSTGPAPGGSQGSWQMLIDICDEVAFRAEQGLCPAGRSVRRRDEAGPAGADDQCGLLLGSGRSAGDKASVARTREPGEAVGASREDAMICRRSGGLSR